MYVWFEGCAVRMNVVGSCTQGARMLLSLMVRGYAQIASTAYAHPATKMVAVQGLIASKTVGDSGFHSFRDYRRFT